MYIIYNLIKLLTFFLVLFDNDSEDESETLNKKLIAATSKSSGLQTKTKLLDNGSIEYSIKFNFMDVNN